MPVSLFFSSFLFFSPHNRMTTRAFGHNSCCDNQSSNVVLRGKMYLTISYSSAFCLSYFPTWGGTAGTDVWMFVFLMFRWFSHYWRSTAMPWCWNTTRPNIYYLHSVNSQQWDLYLFSREEEGTLRCAGHGETDSWAGDFTHYHVNNNRQKYCFVCVSVETVAGQYSRVFPAWSNVGPPLCDQEQMSLRPDHRYRTGLGGLEGDRCCRWRDSASEECDEVSQRSLCLSAQSSQRRSGDRLPRPEFALHPSTFTIGSSSAWFASSGSDWLPCRTLSLVLTALLTHLVTSDPSTWRIITLRACSVPLNQLMWWAVSPFVARSDLLLFVLTRLNYRPLLEKLLCNIS